MQHLPSALAAALLASVACSSFAQLKPAAPPNVIIVLPDQWRAQSFGFAGDANIHTPQLDRLAAESVNCTHAIAGTPVCSPTRASLLTGRRPLSTGVFLNDVPLDPGAVSLAKVLAGAGYDTAYVGKWHLNGGDRSEFIPRERRQGFDYFKALECTHDYNRSRYYEADSARPRQWEGYDAVAQTRDATDYLRTRAGARKPFLLILAWGPPHSPYETAPAAYRAMYLGRDLALRPNVPRTMAFVARAMLANYYAHCTALDDCMGRLREVLKETGLEQNTVLLFTSDHGDLIGSQGGQHKQQPYDECIRVPLLVHWPAGLGTEPRRCDAVMNSEDLMPTVLGFCGLPIPPSVEGRDFSGCIRGGANPGDDTALISCPAPFGEWPRRLGGREYRGVRTARYTYVRDLNGPWLLYDDEADPYQLSNLIGRPEAAAVQARLDGVLDRKLAEAHDRFLPADAYIRQWGYQVDKDGSARYRE